jgi:sugar O-acyltransferase (sialic acid O-acetyltransferase NeuD family)
MHTKVLIIGSGGHAKVVTETLESLLNSTLIAVADQEKSRKDELFLSKYKITLLNEWSSEKMLFHTAIGNNLNRKQVTDECKLEGKSPFNILHKNATISQYSVLELGIFIAANATVASESIIQDGCIINHGAVVDHNCLIGSFSHIAPNATIGGGVKIGEGCLIGSGSTILPNIKIGNNVVIGAGCVVTKNINDFETIIGNPGVKK